MYRVSVLHCFARWIAVPFVLGLLLDGVAIIGGFFGERCWHRAERNAQHLPGAVRGFHGSYSALRLPAVLDTVVSLVDLLVLCSPGDRSALGNADKALRKSCKALIDWTGNG